MGPNTIKFKTIEFINGLSRISKDQNLEPVVCKHLGIEENEDNFKLIKEGVAIYFQTQNRIRLI